MIDKSYDEFGSKTQDSDSRVGLKTENTDSQVGLLPLKFPARTHESGSDTLNKIYSERLSPTQPVSPGTQPVATLVPQTENVSVAETRSQKKDKNV